MDLDKI